MVYKTLTSLLDGLKVCTVYIYISHHYTCLGFVSSLIKAIRVVCMCLHVNVNNVIIPYLLSLTNRL